FERLVSHGRQNVVKRSRGAVRADFGVGMPRVVDHLILVAGRGRAVFRDEVFDSVVAAETDAPFPAQFEVAERLLGDDVAAPFAADFLQDAAFDLPSLFRTGRSTV